MEKLIGKLVQTDGMAGFVEDFITWAGANTALVRLELETTGMALEIVCERNSDRPLISARGLAGGGSAVADWADAEGYTIVKDEEDFVTVEVKPKEASKVAHALAKFLAPSGRWRITDVNIRRKAR